MADPQEHTERTVPEILTSETHQDEERFAGDNMVDPERAGDRITVLPGATETAASFQFDNEDHTLGNALRYVIMKNPAVEFCGYSIPHPSEAKLNLRIQTYDNTSVYEVLAKGLKDLEDVCDVVLDKFESAVAEKSAGAGGSEVEMRDV